MALRELKELKNKDAKEILDYVFYGDSAHGSKNAKGAWVRDYYFKSIAFLPLEKDGKRKLTLDFQPVVGIIYTDSTGDGLLLRFTNYKVIEWLFNHKFNILHLVKEVCDHYTDIDTEYDELYEQARTACKKYLIKIYP